MSHGPLGADGLQVGVALDLAPVAGETYADRLSTLQPVIDAVDRLGLHSISAGESYPARRDDPMGFHAPNALIMLSAIASRTCVPQLITGALLLSSWPIERLVRDVSLTDQLCNGRLVLGLGLGPLDLWARRGVMRTDIAARVDSIIVELRDRLGDGTAPGPAAESVPIWIGGALSRSVIRAAELGDGYTVSTGYSSTVVSERSSEYWAQRGPRPGAVSINRACVVAATVHEVERRAAAGLRPLLRSYAGAGAIAGCDAATNDVQLAREVALLGTPDQVAAQVSAYVTAGVTHIQLRVAPGQTDVAVAIESLELFVNHVLPRITGVAAGPASPTAGVPA